MALTISNRDKSVLNFDENFAVAVRRIFCDNGLEDIFSIPGEALEQADVSGEVVFETGQSMNKGYVDAYPAADPESDGIVDDFYTGTLTVTIRTPRDATGQYPAISADILTRHNEICAMVRAVLQTHRRPFDSLGDSFSYYAVKFIRPVGTRHVPDMDFMQDVSTLAFQVEWAIRPEAWAAVDTP